MTRVLIAGIGGASLGTEVLKALILAGRTDIIGCDISPRAYGRFCPEFSATHIVSRETYVDDVLDLCAREDITAVIPGGEEPLCQLGAARDRLQTANVTLCANTPRVNAVCADKAATMRRLAEIGVRVPRARQASSPEDALDFTYPCVVKPNTGSGGSAFVFLATDADEAQVYVHFLLKNGKAPLLQEYIDVCDGEFTVGVLSLPGGALVGSVAMRRAFDARLSVAFSGPAGLISSGYSQGQIGDFAEVRATCEAIAVGLASEGPLNIQGRARGGEFLPFEINARFSASTYLRALAGFNEIDLYLRHLEGEPVMAPRVRPGLYLRSLTEVVVPDRQAAVA